MDGRAKPGHGDLSWLHAAHLLFRRRIVLAAIDFDDQFRLMADEIDNKAPQRHLTAKSVTIRLARAQPLPDLFLGFGRDCSALACSRAPLLGCFFI